MENGPKETEQRSHPGDVYTQKLLCLSAKHLPLTVFISVSVSSDTDAGVLKLPLNSALQQIPQSRKTQEKLQLQFQSEKP